MQNKVLSIMSALLVALHTAQGYDFIIVGGGTAGCVLANRLSENPEWSVLLLEAGGQEYFWMDIPMNVYKLQLMNEMNWKYQIEPNDGYCRAMNNGQCRWSRGKVLGGSSVVNHMIYTRGNRNNYDDWLEAGCEGWGYDNVTKYFEKLENKMNPKTGRRTQGPVKICYPETLSYTTEMFIQACNEKGTPRVDYNGPTQIGTSYVQTTIDRGSKISSNAAYIQPILRPNLTVKLHSTVTKILIDPETNTAVGVQYTSESMIYLEMAAKEVIISAGAIESPHLLMLSGIGPADELESKNITLITDAAVGYNLIDQIFPIGLTFLTNITTFKPFSFLLPLHLISYFLFGTGPLTSAGGMEALTFLDSSNYTNPNGSADIELLFVNGHFADKADIAENLNLNNSILQDYYLKMTGRVSNAFMILPIILKPESRGQVVLKTNNPADKPLVFPNYFSEPADVKLGIEAIRKAIDLMDTKAMRTINATFYNTPYPLCKTLPLGSDEYWECFLRATTTSIRHPAGTCKMGPPTDETAVVDPRLRMYGVERLRVVGASIMPNPISGHPVGPVMMIAEKAADMIKQDWVGK